jgi:hypothetical protein
MLAWPFAGKVDGRGRFRRPDRSVSSAIWGAIQRYSAEGVPRGLRLMAEAAIRPHVRFRGRTSCIGSALKGAFVRRPAADRDENAATSRRRSTRGVGHADLA